MALPFLTLYLTRHLGFPAEDAGLAVTFYGLGVLVTAPLSGMLSDAVGPLRVMKISLLATALVLALFPLVRSFPLILACVLLWSVISEAFRPANLAIITDLVPPENRKGAFTLNRLAVNLGMSIGPAIGGFLFLSSPVTLFWVDGGTSLAAGILLIFMTSAVGLREDIHARRETGAKPANPFAPLADRRLVYFLVALLPIFLIFFLHETAMPLYLVRDQGLPESAYGIMFTVNTALIITIEVPLNLATARVPHGRMLSIGSLLVGLGFGSLMFVSSVAGVIATVVVWTFGEMIMLPVASTYTSEIAPVERRGAYMGLFQMSFGVAFALSAWGGTWVLDHFGGTVLWGGALIASCLSAWALARVKSP